MNFITINNENRKIFLRKFFLRVYPFPRLFITQLREQSYLKYEFKNNKRLRVDISK